MKFCAEIDLEIIRIVKHIKKTAPFFKFRNTKTNKSNFSEKSQYFHALLWKILFMLSQLWNLCCLWQKVKNSTSKNNIPCTTILKSFNILRIVFLLLSVHWAAVGGVGTHKLQIPPMAWERCPAFYSTERCALSKSLSIKWLADLGDSGSLRSVKPQNVSKTRKVVCGGSKGTSLIVEILEEWSNMEHHLFWTQQVVYFIAIKTILRLPIRTCYFMPKVGKYIL